MKIKAKDIMSTQIVTITPNASVEEALKLIVNHRITGLPVVNKAGRLLGILSEYDLLKQISGKDDGATPLGFSREIKFSEKIEAVDQETPLTDVVGRFIKSRFRRLPVLNKNKKIIGIITRRDLMRVYFYQAKLPS